MSEFSNSTPCLNISSSSGEVTKAGSSPSHHAASHPIAAVAPRFVHKSVHNTARSKCSSLGVSFHAPVRKTLIVASSLSTVLIYSPSVSCRNSTVTYFGSNTRTSRRGNGQIFTTAVSSTAWARCSAVISSHRWCSYRALPQRFARVHRRYQTPWFGTLVVGVSGCTIDLVPKGGPAQSFHVVHQTVATVSSGSGPQASADGMSATHAGPFQAAWGVGFGNARARSSSSRRL